jgi:murein DD-endopeptidase MepM/ murein hydrolase activator NlpD
MIRAIAAGTVGIALLLGGGTALAGVVTGYPAAANGFVRPVDGAWVSQEFGCTTYAFEPVDANCPGRHWHSGIDLAADRGTRVRATLGGVATVVHSTAGYGLHVIIDHGNGLLSLYAHLGSVVIASGDTVASGQVIGAVGSTGNSTGPHLHFELRRDGVAEDPRAEMTLP